MNIGMLGKVFYPLCIIFGILNIAGGGAIVFYSYQLNSQLSSSLSEVNGALSASSGILSNINTLALVAASSGQSTSQNVTNMLNNFSASISTIQNELQQEANIFNNGSAAQYYPKSAQIGDAFGSLAAQFGLMNNYGIPPLRRLINNTFSHVITPLSSISQETSSLNDDLSSMASTFNSDMSMVQSTVPTLFLGFGAYLMLQGVLFILLGKISSYLISNASVPKPTPAPKGKSKKQKEVKEPTEPPASTENEDEGKGKGNLGIIGSIKDALGIE